INSSGTSSNKLKYTGRELDSETGLYYYRARYYDPEVGRFLSEDPLGFEAGINFYVYCKNNPVNFNDPSGHLADILIDAAFIGYDIYSLVKNPGWDTAAALGLDIVGAAVPFVTGLGQARHLTSIANRADNIPLPVGTRPNVAGTFKHSEAERIVNLEMPNLNTEVSYLGGIADVPRNTPGSVRLDVVSGALENPTQVFDFKFGQSGLINSRIDNIYSQVGSSSFPITEIRPGALPARTSGLGAAYNLGNDMFGDSGYAGGGFVLYPSKPNTNMMKSVYLK
ncbi:MAG: RHS repeat-associated core domain-containing protein, partial [Chloroflexota bacterium]|nr:RHS repeat-associated core domain-containing protein [Chloroflexota bacterium]